MKTNFIYSASYHEALRQVISVINARNVDLHVRHLLIVPERYTLLAEKMLYENSEGSFDVEVLSLSRLFFKMNIPMPLISREGAIMLIRGMLSSLSLKCYRHPAYRGFCEKLYDAINDFAAGKIRPEDIPETSPKLCDLKAIYTEYLNRISGRYVDNMGKLALISKYAEESSYLNNVHIYVANFDYVDSATREVFDVLLKRALSFTECVVRGDIGMRCKAETFCGEGALSVKEVAKKLRFSAYNGVKYEEMAVITGNADNARIKRIFGEFDIPCFIAGGKSLYDFPLPSFFVKLFECVGRKRRQSVIELSKNIFSRIDKESSDIFENYVNSHLIDYKGFDEKFVDVTAESVRNELVCLIDRVNDKSKRVCDARSLRKLIEDVIAFARIENTLEENFDSDVQLEKVRALLELMEQVDIKGKFEFVFAVFVEGLKASKVSGLPNAGGVTVGDPAAFRGGKYKLLAVIGFDDGFLPQIYDDSSLIGDEDKTYFTQMERAEAINRRYERELLADLCSADNVFITYSKPSGMVESLPINKDITRDIVYEAGSFKHATELLISLKRRDEDYGENHARQIATLFAATGINESKLTSPRVDKVNDGEKLFFPCLATSVSQLQSYFACPLRHFFNYGLRLKERDKGEVTALDIGSFLHAIVERIVKSGDYSDIEGSVKKIVSSIGGKLTLEANKNILDALIREGTEAIGIYVSHLAKGKFKPVGQEIEFESTLGGLKLSGKIDMADEYDGYIRLIDYKTGKGYELGMPDIYFGEKIQLPLYMAAASKKYKKGAMFDFPLSYEWAHDKTDHRFSGFLLGEEDIMNAVDEAEGESEVFNLKRMRNNTLLTREEMDDMIDYAIKLGENAIKEISSGNIASSPNETECNYCEYACLCTNKKIRRYYSVEKKSFKGGN